MCAVLIGGFSVSCEKGITEEVAQQQTKNNVTIRVSSVEADWNASTTRALVNVGEVCSRLCFAVYQDGTRIKSKNQEVGESDFGTFNLNLNPGEYTVLVLAHSGRANPTTTKPEKIQFTNPESSGGTGFSDTFYYYGKMTVDEDNTDVNISMKRATAMFRLVTTDIKPANVKKFQFYYEGGSGALDATTGLGCVDSKQSVFVATGDELTGKTLVFDMFTIPRSEKAKLNIIVKAFDSKDDILYQREFNDVVVQQNCITRYTGKYFVKDSPDKPDIPDEPDDPEVEPKSMVVMVDAEWASIIDFDF